MSAPRDGGVVEDLAEVVEPDPGRVTADPVPVGECVPRPGARRDVPEREDHGDGWKDPDPWHRPTATAGVADERAQRAQTRSTWRGSTHRRR